jgi:hypothetical protein
VNQYAALGSSIPCGNNIIYIVHQLIIYPRDAIILFSDLNNDVSITAGEKTDQLIGLVAKFTLVGAVNNGRITAFVLTNAVIATPGPVSYEAIKGPTVSPVWCAAKR